FQALKGRRRPWTKIPHRISPLHRLIVVACNRLGISSKCSGGLNAIDLFGTSWPQCFGSFLAWATMLTREKRCERPVTRQHECPDRGERNRDQKDRSIGRFSTVQGWTVFHGKASGLRFRRGASRNVEQGRRLRIWRGMPTIDEVRRREGFGAGRF